MSLVCEFELLSPALPLTAIAADLETVFHVDDVISGTKGSPAIVFSATNMAPERLESAMDDADLLTEWVGLETAFDESRYRAVLKGDPTGIYTHLVDLRTHPIGALVTGRGWNVSARFADQSDLDAFRNACDDTAVDFRPLRIFETDAEKTDDYGLTAPQHEALLAAYRQGYFEVPRNANLADLAANLDTTTSALSERLRRGHRRLIERTIASSTE